MPSPPPAVRVAPLASDRPSSPRVSLRSPGRDFTRLCLIAPQFKPVPASHPRHPIAHPAQS